MYINDMLGLKNIRKFMSTITENKFDTTREELVKVLDKKILGKGVCREVYSFTDTHVIKVPRPGGGNSYRHNCMTNILEYLMYKRLHDKIPLADCFIVFFGCIPLIKMERVGVLDKGDNDGKEYAWIRQNPDSILGRLNDGYQIGTNRDGRVVCYDYGYEGGLFENILTSGKYDESAVDLTDDELKELKTFSPKITGLEETNEYLRNRLIGAFYRSKQLLS